MSITTTDGVLAGMLPVRDFGKGSTGTMVAGRPFSTWYLNGFPGAASNPTSGMAGEVLTSPVSGQIGFDNPAIGNSYLAFLKGQATQPGMLMLIDRIWQGGGNISASTDKINVTLTTEQSFSTPAPIPARDNNGEITGEGVFAGVEVISACGAAAPTLTLKYLNTSGQTKTATNLTPTTTTSPAGTFYMMRLAAGDYGIQKAVSLTLSTSWLSGIINVVLYRIIARLPLTTANIPNMVDCLSGGFDRIYDNSVLQLIFIPQTTTSTYINGSVGICQG
jgi:hypothetical protein